MMMAQSLFIRLQQRNPELIIDVLAPAWSLPLLECMPEVNQGITMPLGHGKLGLGKRYQLGKELRKEQYDCSIVLPNSWKSAIIPFAANIPKRIGYKGEMRYGLLTDIHHLDKDQLTMTVQRFVALAHSPNNIQAATKNYPYPRLEITENEKQQCRTTFNLGNTNIITLCPGAEYGSAKRWPAEYFAELAKQLIEKGWQICLAGSEKDADITDAIAQAVNHDNCINLAGKTSLKEVTTLLALSDQVISNDSGLMHIAAAVNTPVIAIYGSSDPNFTPPLSDNAQIVSLNLECSPCFKRECPLEHLDCLKHISVEQVLAHVS
jgi:heptosyltransferase-2